MKKHFFDSIGRHRYDNWSVNAAAGLSDSNVTFRAGTNYKIKLF